MSCWICGNKTLSLVADTVQKITDGYDDKEELMKELSRLNIKTVEQYYGDTDCGHTDVINNVKYIKLDVEDAQRHKSVCCYLYQTDDYVKSPLIDVLKRWSEHTRNAYEPYWDLYKWDIDSHF